MPTHVPMIDPEKARRETLRWTILVALNSARPYGAVEPVLLATVQGVFPDCTHTELRKELDYLADRQLLENKNIQGPVWKSELTRVGVDVVEYTVDCEPGIARPEKYW